MGVADAPGRPVAHRRLEHCVHVRSEDVDGDGIATMAGRHAVLDHPVDPAQDRRNAGFAYVDGVLADGDTLRLCRLRYVGSSHN